MRVVRNTDKGVLLRLTEYMGEDVALKDQNIELCQEVELPFHNLMDWYPTLEGYYIRYDAENDKVIVQFTDEGIVKGTTVDITDRFDCEFDVENGVLVNTLGSIFTAFSMYNHNTLKTASDEYKAPHNLLEEAHIEAQLRTLLKDRTSPNDTISVLYKLYQAQRRLLRGGKVACL